MSIKKNLNMYRANFWRAALLILKWSLPELLKKSFSQVSGRGRNLKRGQENLKKTTEEQTRRGKARYVQDMTKHKHEGDSGKKIGEIAGKSGRDRKARLLTFPQNVLKFF
jgi:hypothetical protein